MSGTDCWGLVDSGAGLTLCSVDLLPCDYPIQRDSGVNIKGVTGAHLELIGVTEIELKIGDFCEKTEVYVVEKMADNVFIVGRDILEQFGCIIDFKNLQFKIGDVSLPLFKAHPKSDRINKFNLHCTKTVIIPPYAHGHVACHLRKKGMSRSFASLTGSTEINLVSHDELLVGEDCICNTKRGRTDVHVVNMSDKTLCLYRNSKVGTFNSFHVREINTMNCCTVQCEPGPGVEQSVSDKKESNYTRWSGDKIEELYDIMGLNSRPDLTEAQIKSTKSLIADFRDIFAENDNDIGCTDIMEQEIILDTDLPIRDKYYNIPLALRAHAEKEVRRLMDLKIVQPSTSPYHSPSFLMKKSDGSYRLLTDFRKVNEHVIRSWTPVPGLEEMLVLWKGCLFFSKMDFIKGFYQTKLKPESRKYTATSIPGIGFIEYIRSPLGLSNSPCFFQGLVERIFMGLKQSQCVVFLDDCLSGAKTFDEMIANLRAIFGRIRTSKMLLKPQKCQFWQRSLVFLGYTLDKNGISPCKDKVESMMKMCPPGSVKGVRSFLGLSGFYRRFIKDYSSIALPLTRMTKKGAVFKWTPEAQKAWETIKTKLSEAPVLAHPDINKPFVLITDASGYCIGGILAQNDDFGVLHPISYGSAVLSESQQKWATWQRELYALVHFCEKYHTFLVSTDFKVIVDNTALLHLGTMKGRKSPKLWRWFQSLEQYRFTVEYRPSKQNPSDALSRLPKTNDPLLHALPDNAEIMKTKHVNAATVSSGNIVNSSPATDVLHTGQNNDSSSPVDLSKSKGPLIFYTNDTMKTAQENDSALKTVKSWLECNEKPKSSKNLSGDLYTYYHSFSRLSIHQGVICREWQTKTSEKSAYLVCVPESLQSDVIKAAHDIPSSGHLGPVKTIDRIRNRFYFPKCDIKTRLHIGACHVCIKKQRSYKKLRAPLSPSAGMEPGHIIQMDLIENLPAANGYHAILVIIDTFSKWAEAIPLRDTKAEYVAKQFLNVWVSRQSLPSIVMTDRGGNVDTAHILKVVYELLQIDKHSTLSYRPQSDGQVERLNQTIKNMLWKYCQENPRNWIACLDQVMFAYRTSVHSATGYSPFFLEKGRLPRLPMDVLLGTAPVDSLVEEYGEAALELYTKLREIYAFVRENIKSKQVSSKKRYDEDKYVKSYKVGSWVYVWKPAPQGCTYKKFYDNFRGPFKILEKVTSHTYKIVIDEDKGTSDIVHMEHLKDAKIPEGERPAVVVKHYSDQPSSGANLREIDVENNVGDETSEVVLPEEGSDSGSVLFRVHAPVPLRRSTRDRRQHVPYQHRG